MSTRVFRSPPLPIPTKVYDQKYMNSLIRTLEQYFHRQDSRDPLVSEADARRYALLVGGK